MKVLESLKRTMESIEDMKNPKTFENEEFSVLFEKYKDIPKEVLMDIVKDVKEHCMAKETTELAEPIEDTTVNEDLNNVDSKEIDSAHDVEHTDTAKAESCSMKNELDASEGDEMEDEDDELIISEEGDEMEDEDDELIISEEDDEMPEEPEDEDFDVYKDELDIVESDDEEMPEEPDEITEGAEKIDMNIPEDDVAVDAADKAMHEGAEKIDMNIPEDDVPVDAADKAAKEINNGAKNEDNSGAKAAVANRQAKGNFSSDIDDLTDYLNDY